MKKRMIATLALTITLLAMPPGKGASTTEAVGASLAQDSGVAETTAVVTDGQGLVVDIYQDMESGTDGELLTPAIMNASSHGGVGAITATWDFKYGDQMWVSTAHARELPGGVTVNGIHYSGASTRTWRYRNREENQCVRVRFGYNQWDAPDHDRITVAGYYTTEQTDPFSNQHDTIEVGGLQSFGVMQTIGDTGPNPPYVRAHSCITGWVSTVSPQIIKVIPGKTYWVNLHYDGPAGKVKVAVFDPDDDWTQVGETAIAESVPGSAVRSYVHFGQCSPHGNYPNNDTSAYFEHILVDVTNAPFPLLPVPALKLRGAPGNRAIHLNWTVNATLPATTWRIDYYTTTAAILTATDPLSATRAYTLTGLTNYQWYTVTLSTVGATPLLSDTVRVMPTDRFVYLPLVLNDAARRVTRRH